MITGPLKFGWKKKPDSKPEPPVLDSVPASRVRTTYRSEKKKLEPKTNENISPEPVSLENRIQDVKVVAFSFLSCSPSALMCPILWLIRHPF